jgi:hypothetical protein
VKSIVAAFAGVLALLLSSQAGAAPPPGAPQPTFAFDPHGSTGWLPLEVNSDHHAYFKLKVNGRTAVAMLDLNRPHTTLDAAFAAAAGVSAGQRLQLDFPRLAVQGLAPTLTDLAPLSAALRHPLDVIVGSDALVGVVADIDLLGHRLSLTDQAGYSFPDAARYTHLVRRGDVWLAPVSIEGHRSALFALDMLVSDDLQIAPDYARSLRLEPSAGAELIANDGVLPVAQAGLGQMKFAGAVMTDVTADVPQRLSAAYADDAKGALGIGVLRRYRLILDLQHDRLYSLLINTTEGLHLDIFTLLRQTPVPNFGARPAGAF